MLAARFRARRPALPLFLALPSQKMTPFCLFIARRKLLLSFPLYRRASSPRNNTEWKSAVVYRPIVMCSGTIEITRARGELKECHGSTHA